MMIAYSVIAFGARAHTRARARADAVVVRARGSYVQDGTNPVAFKELRLSVFDACPAPGVDRARSFSVALSRRVNFEDNEYWEETGIQDDQTKRGKTPWRCNILCIIPVWNFFPKSLKGILIDTCAEAARKHDAETGREALLITIVDKYGQKQEEELHFEDSDHLAALEDQFHASITHVHEHNQQVHGDVTVIGMKNQWQQKLQCGTGGKWLGDWGRSISRAILVVLLCLVALLWIRSTAIDVFAPGKKSMSGKMLRHGFYYDFGYGFEDRRHHDDDGR